MQCDMCSLMQSLNCDKCGSVCAQIRVEVRKCIEVGQALLLFSHDWTSTGISFIFLLVTVYMRLHSTLNAQIISFHFPFNSNAVNNLIHKNIHIQQQI